MHFFQPLFTRNYSTTYLRNKRLLLFFEIGILVVLVGPVGIWVHSCIQIDEARIISIFVSFLYLILWG